MHDISCDLLFFRDNKESQIVLYEKYNFDGFD